MKKLALIAGILALSACSTTPQSTLLTNVALSSATARYIQSGDATVRSSRILTHIKALRASFTKDDTINSNTTVMAAINQRIDWTKLSPEDQVLATVVLQLIGDSIKPGIQVDIKILNQVFDIIQQVALRYK